MRTLLFIIFLGSLLQNISAQVGIGTTSPDPSAILDINSTNQGLLIPRISLSDVTDTSLDGTNTAATGLLVWNTNAAVTGGSGIGYYSFNEMRWQKLTTAADNTKVLLKVQSSSTGGSISSGTNMVPFLDTVAINYGSGAYDTATGTYTIPENGVYEIDLSFNVGIVAPYEMVMSYRVYLNGVYYATKFEQKGNSINPSFGVTFSTSFTEEFLTGDQVELRVFPLENTTVYGGATTAGRATNIIIKKIY